MAGHYRNDVCQHCKENKSCRGALVDFAEELCSEWAEKENGSLK